MLRLICCMLTQIWCDDGMLAKLGRSSETWGFEVRLGDQCT